jgi:hypothetical protein
MVAIRKVWWYWSVAGGILQLIHCDQSGNLHAISTAFGDHAQRGLHSVNSMAELLANIGLNFAGDRVFGTRNHQR